MLLLAGWYLMLVPKSDSPKSLPIPWFAIQKSFDTARECERARPKGSLQATNKASVAGAGYLCVASDDPRLATMSAAESSAARAVAWSDTLALARPAATPKPGTPAALMASMKPGAVMVVDGERLRAKFDASWLGHQGDPVATMADMRKYVADALKNGPPGPGLAPPSGERPF